MHIFLLVVQIIVAISLVGIILLQKNNSDGLSGFGASSSGGNIFSSRGTANFLTQLTTILAIIFLLNSLLLANLAGKEAPKASFADKVMEHSEKNDNASKPAPKEETEKAPEVPVAK